MTSPTFFKQDNHRSPMMQQALALMSRPRRITNEGEGVYSAAQSIAGALMMNKEQEAAEKRQADNRAAMADALSGGMAKPWVNPDTQKVSDAPAGGYDGMLSALSRHPESDVAAALAPQLVQAKIGREQAIADRDEERRYAESLQPTFETVDNPYGRGGVGQRNTRSGQIVNYQAPQTSKTDSDILEINQLLATLAQIPEGDPRRAPYQARLTKITSSQPLAQVNMNPGEPKANEELGKAIGGRLAAQVEAGDKAYTNLQTLNLMESASSQLEQAGGATGALAEPSMFATSLMQAAGFDPTSLNLPADAGPSQVLNSLSNKLTLGKIGGPDGMPANNFSDADRAFIESTVPRLTDTPSAFRAKLFIDKRMAERSIAVARAVEDGYNQGQSASEIGQTVAEIKRQPLFDESEIQTLQAATGGETGTAQPYKPSGSGSQRRKVIRNPQTGALEFAQ